MLAITMRMESVSYASGNTELRDCLSHDWWKFLALALPVEAVLPVPNLGEKVEKYLSAFPRIHGLILTGGDDWGIFPLRDATEEKILQFAFAHNWPVLGVCRGAQLINLLCGGKNCAGFAKSHVNKRHALKLCENAPLEAKALEVNSFHDQVIQDDCLGTGLRAWGHDLDGNVEAFSAISGSFHGIMWHPEREMQPAWHDLDLFRKIFAKE